MADNTYNDAYQGVRTQEHPRFGRGGTDISAVNAGQTIGRRPKQIDAAVDAADPPAPKMPAMPAPAAETTGAAVQFDKADPERERKRRMGPPKSML